MDSILELPVTILNRQDNEHDIRFTVEVEDERIVCPGCGSIGNANRFGKLSQVFMDMPIRTKRVGLDIQRRRYRCKDCNRTFMQSLPFLDEKRAATSRLISYIEGQSLQRTFTSIANDVGVTEATVRSIFKDRIRYLEATIHFETPEWLGLDELKLMKRMRGMVTNVKDGTVIDILQNRDMTTVRRYLNNLRDKERIKVVAMDMWVPYRQCVREVLPQAQVVVDKFHVLKPANTAMEKVRKEIRRTLADRPRRGLMHDRFILLRRRHGLKEKDILKRESWFGLYPQLGVAYHLKESFFDIYDAPTKEAAQELYDEWEHSIPEDLGWAFQDVITYMTNWREEIFAYFEYGGATNAYTEAVNGLAKLTNKIGRGYSFEAIRAKVLYGDGLKKQSKPKFPKRGRGLSDFSDAKFYELLGHMPNVETDKYITLGNDISTLTQHLEQDDF